MKKLFLFIAVVLSFATLNTFAQQQQGDIELGAQGYLMFMSSSGYSSTMGSIAGKLGYQFTDNINAGFAPQISFTSSSFGSGSSNTTTTFGGGFYGSYSFMLSNPEWVPYVQAQYYKSDFSDSQNKGSIAFGPGIKYFFTKKAAFDVNLSYAYDLSDYGGGSKPTMILMWFGLTIYL